MTQPAAWQVCINVISGAPRPVLERCLAQVEAACRAAAPIRTAVLFVDNSGCRAERWVADAYPDWGYVAQPQPRGFAANANLALSRSDADGVLLLNSDAFLQDDTLPMLVNALTRRPTWAAVSAHLQNPDGSDQGTAFDFPSLRSTLLALSGARRTCFLHGCQRPVGTKDVEADWVPAACLLVRRAAVESVGLLDEGFDPGYGEDIDWCRRAKRTGWGVGVCAAARVTHLGGASFGALGAEQFALFVRHLCRYHRKHHPVWEAHALMALITIGLTARGLFTGREGRYCSGARAALSSALLSRES